MTDLSPQNISQNIQDYFEARLAQIRPEEEITFSIYLFFRKNMHIIVFRKKGDRPTKEFLDRYLTKGPAKIWINKEEQELFNEYIRLAPPVESSSNLETELATSQSPSVDRDFLQLHQEYSEALKELMSPDTSEPKQAKTKNALIAKKARELIKISIDSPNLDQQIQANAMIRQVVKDLLDGRDYSLKEMINELWQLTKEDPTLTHGANVSSYTFLLALSFGKTDPILLEDLAIAGLLHDVGLTQIPANLSSNPWNSLTPEQKTIYTQHVQSGVDVINAFAENIPERVQIFIQSQHEKYNGTGYPNAIKGFKTDPVIQFLILAELLDSIASGQWDGTERRYYDALGEIIRLEQNPELGGYFFLGLISSILKYCQLTEADF